MEQALMMTGIGITGGVVPFVIGKMIEFPYGEVERDGYKLGAIIGTIGGVVLGGSMVIAFALLD